MPQFLINENIPRSTGRLLKEHGYTIEDIRDFGLRGIEDENVLLLAARRQAVLLTADKEFANILWFLSGNHSGILVLQFPKEMSTTEINRHVIEGLKNLAEEDFKGNLIILEPGRLRKRKQ